MVVSNHFRSLLRMALQMPTVLGVERSLDISDPWR